MMRIMIHGTTPFAGPETPTTQKTTLSLQDELKITPLDAHIWVPVLSNRGSPKVAATTTLSPTTTRKSTKRAKKKALAGSKDQLPKGHPLRKVVPETARILGLKQRGRNRSLLKSPVATSQWAQTASGDLWKPGHGIMSVSDFLKRYPDMEKIHGAVPGMADAILYRRPQLSNL